jgi:phage regulator Rha-like protein
MNTAMRAILIDPPTKYAVANQPDTAITDRIHVIRGQKVMLDRDLAELYGVEVKRLKEQVRRNSDRFPEDFMFELTKVEWDLLRSQFATLKQGAHTKYLPFAFTEHGILMLANVLRSEQAIAVSIRIIRIFNRMREVLLSHKEILQRLEQLEGRVTGHDEEIQAIFDHLTALVTRPEAPRRAIGFKQHQA